MDRTAASFHRKPKNEVAKLDPQVASLETSPDYRLSRYAQFTEAVLERLGAANAPTGRSYVDAKRASGSKPSTLRNIACFLQNLDELSHGRDWKTLTATDLAASLARYARAHQPPSVHQFSVNARAFYRWLNNGVLPPDIKRALSVRRPKRKPKAVITPEQFEGLLKAAWGQNLAQRGWMRQALLWVLWDTGFRISEALALRVGDVTISPDSAAYLELPPDAPHLKTGPRRIFAIECAPALRAWLAHHPRANDPRAPLFPSDRVPNRALQPPTVNKLLATQSKKSGLPRAITCHQFRHTRATRAAKAGWNEHQLNTYFGWAPGSRESATYVHMTAADVEEKLRAEFGIRPPTSAPAAAQPAPAQSQAELVAETLALTLAALSKQAR